MRWTTRFGHEGKRVGSSLARDSRLINLWTGLCYRINLDVCCCFPFLSIFCFFIHHDWMNYPYMGFQFIWFYQSCLCLFPSVLWECFLTHTMRLLCAHMNTHWNTHMYMYVLALCRSIHREHTKNLFSLTVLCIERARLWLIRDQSRGVRSWRTIFLW